MSVCQTVLLPLFYSLYLSGPTDQLMTQQYGGVMPVSLVGCAYLLSLGIVQNWRVKAVEQFALSKLSRRAHIQKRRLGFQ